MCIGVFTTLVAVVVLAFFSKARPEEIPPRSLVQFGRFYFASGMTSHQDMMDLIRKVSGVETIPPPAARVAGSAGNEKDHIPMSPSEASQFVADVEKGVQEQVAQLAKNLISQSGEKEPSTAEGGPILEAKKNLPS
jgi:hypothetical protein